MTARVRYSAAAEGLLRQGAITFARIEAAGMRVDLEWLDRTVRESQRQAARVLEEIERCSEYKIWRRRFGLRTNLSSDWQCGVVLFDLCSYKSAGETQSGRYRVDREALEDLDSPFVRALLRLRSLHKVARTHLVDIRRETIDGFVHPNLNLHSVISYRSSSDSPNLQNVPVRDAEQMNAVRSCFIPRAKDRQLVEIDLKGIEVAVAACYHQDPRMLEYLRDKTKDMHRDMAAQCYLLPEHAVSKEARYGAKNKYVFPEFYGSFYVDCARSLWRWAARVKHKEGTLQDHLRRKGVRSLGACDPERDPRRGTFERHIQEVENDFWGRRFRVYAEWKQEWYSAYRKRGWFQSKTGFVYQGYMRRNEVINYPMQGSAFHVLLKGLIQLVLHEIPRRRLDALVVNQVHDCIIGDVHKDCVPEYVVCVREILTRWLPRVWDWIIVPIDVEVEVSPPGEPWSRKEHYGVV